MGKVRERRQHSGPVGDRFASQGIVVEDISRREDLRRETLDALFVELYGAADDGGQAFRRLVDDYGAGSDTSIAQILLHLSDFINSLPNPRQWLTDAEAQPTRMAEELDTIQQDRLDAELAHALMSINAVKGVEIGAGFESVVQKGTEHRDEMTPEGFLTNHAGGVLGGISSGQDILASIALKPTSSLRLPGRSINLAGESVEVVTEGRHDPCVGIRATPIAEAMMAIVLMDHVLRHRAQNMDVVSKTPVIPSSV